MNVNGIEATGYEIGKTMVHTAKDGSQRFDRGIAGEKPGKSLPFGTVLTEKELYQYVDNKMKQNQCSKKSLEDMIKDSCIGWSTATFKFVGESKSYNYYDFIKEMEMRSKNNG